MEEDTGENGLVIRNKDRIAIFYRTYKKSIITMTTPLLLLPVAFLGEAYKSFFLFLVCAVYWTTGVVHPAVVGFLPIVFLTIMGASGLKAVNAVHVRNPTLDCLGVMMITMAVENCNIHRRVALKVLLIFGISHFRLSFLLFFFTMFLSMCCTETLSCALMLPVVKATLVELEKMGILEMHEAAHKDEGPLQSSEPTRPTDFTIFYFLGVTYSSTLGRTAGFFGNSPNKIFLNFYQASFPYRPTVEYPHILLLTLPGVLIMETLLYMWFNFYFLGMLRVQNYTPLETGLTGEEAQYANSLLAQQYTELGSVTFQEMVVACVVILTAVLEVCIGFMNVSYAGSYEEVFVSTPSIIGAFLLFVIPANIDCIKFFKRRESTGPLPAITSKACLDWNSVIKDFHWTAIFVTAGCNTMFETLNDTGITDELGRFLGLFSDWFTSSLIFVIIILCKVLTEFASNSTVTWCMLQQVAKLSTSADPRHVMLGAVLGCSLPFHLLTSSPSNVMVALYANIPPRKMMLVGIGPTIIAIPTVLFTICIWSKVIWPSVEYSN